MIANKYLIFVIMGIILLFSLEEKSDDRKKRCIQIITVVLTCFSGFRSWQMGDVYHYMYAFQECNAEGWQLEVSGGSEDTIGLQLLYRVIGQLGLEFNVCLFVIAAFVAITLGILVYKYSPSPFWSYVIYLAMGFYISSFNVLKQVIAMGFIMLAMIAIVEKRPVRFLVLMAIAGIFHTPALIFLGAYPFARKKFDAYYFLLVALMLGAVFVFRNQLVEFLSDLYYEGEVTFEATEVLGGKVVMMVFILLLALLLRPVRYYDNIYRMFFNVMVLALIVQTFSVYDNVFSRLADYFYQFVVIFIPLMLQPGEEQAEQYPAHKGEIRCFTDRSYTLIKTPILIFSVVYYFAYVNSSSALLSEFRFFWQ